MERWIQVSVARADMLLVAAGRVWALVAPLAAGVALPAWASRRRRGRRRGGGVRWTR